MLVLSPFLSQDFVDDNPLTRSLSGNSDADLHKAHFEVAKEILRRKFIIGLFNQIQESVERFQTFFGWKLNNDALSCQRNELKQELEARYNEHARDVNGDGHPGMTPAALEAVTAKNEVDMLLFEYAKFLFDYQGSALFQVLNPATPR